MLHSLQVEQLQRVKHELLVPAFPAVLRLEPMALHVLISTLSQSYVLSPRGQVPTLCVTLPPSQCQLLQSYSCSVWITALKEKRDGEKLAIRESREAKNLMG